MIFTKSTFSMNNENYTFYELLKSGDTHIRFCPVPSNE